MMIVTLQSELARVLAEHSNHPRTYSFDIWQMWEFSGHDEWHCPSQNAHHIVFVLLGRLCARGDEPRMFRARMKGALVRDSRAAIVYNAKIVYSIYASWIFLISH
jgi:hypothetical protein